MQTGFAIDPRQRLDAERELELVQVGAEFGYASAWTPAGADESAFDRCLRWHRASGLEVGISVVPASGRDPAFYAGQAIRVWEGTNGRFVLGVGSGQMGHPAEEMRAYVDALRRQLPAGVPIYVAALGPRMLRLAAELADGVALNWCTPEQVSWSRRIVEQAAAAAGRPVPRIVSYIRTCVAPDPEQARIRPRAAAAGGERGHALLAVPGRGGRGR
jgi:alkanesulfonate monooxygenase SsuD/methylene tetrahydromethanopterin reductase-like flavin-dependent oxidoreductase (luciferase family)